MIFFSFSIEPIAWQRVQRNRWGATFVPDKTRKFKEALKSLAEKQISEFYKDHDYFRYHKKDPIKIEMQFIFTRPKKPTNPFPKQDIDNCAKGVLDALNEVAFEDDKQVVELILRKRYQDFGESPGIIVDVTPVNLMVG